MRDRRKKRLVMVLRKLIGLGAGGLACVLVAVAEPDAAPGASGEITSPTIKNMADNRISGEAVTIAIPLQTGDVPAGTRIQVRKADGTTVVPSQEDSCSKWIQDNSRKVCAVSFVEPDSLLAGRTAVYKIFAVAGPPDTAAKVSPANILAHTDIALKTSNLVRTQGVPEQGVWDLISLNYVLGNCARYRRPGGYGPNPRCGWDVVASGPARYGIHAFQYARRESDHAVHNWLRTDIWVDFWGTDATPCPCSVAVQVSQPNTWGPIAGGS